MKIWFREFDPARVGGPFSFVATLQRWLRGRGVEIEHDFDAPDIDAALVVATIETPELRALKRRGVPLVQRVDGVPFRTPGVNFAHETARLRRCYGVADAVVFQSQFSRAIVERTLGPVGCEARTVYNGVDLSVFSSAEAADLHPHLCSRGDGVGQPPPADKGLTLACASVWRPHKRLGATVRGFLKFHERAPDSRLLVIGPTERAGSNLPADPAIRYLGGMSHEDAARALGPADVFLHLAWLDWCPNVVLEAQAMGLPVVCANSGGTSEILVKDTGAVIDCDPPAPPPTETDIYDPTVVPDVPSDRVAHAVADIARDLKAQRRKLLDARAWLSIERAGREYLDLFQGLASGAVPRPRGRGYWSLAAKALVRRCLGIGPLMGADGRG